MSLQILPVNIKGLAGSIATLGNWFTSWAITMSANLLLTWSNGGQLSPVFQCYADVSVHVFMYRMLLSVHYVYISCIYASRYLSSLQGLLPYTLL